MSAEGNEPMDDLLQEMIRPAGPTPADRARRRRLVASAVIIGIAVFGVTGLTTSALFNDQDDAGANGFTTGSVSIDATPDAVDITTSPLLAPGDTTYFPITVSNNGSLAQRYAIKYTSASTNSASAPAGRAAPDLASQVVLTLWANPTGSCDASIVTSTPLATLASMSSDGTLHTLVGSTDIGAQPGDRQLDSGAHEQLCTSLHIPVELDNTYTDSSVAVAMTFFAEQVANNP